LSEKRKFFYRSGRRERSAAQPQPNTLQDRIRPQISPMNFARRSRNQTRTNATADCADFADLKRHRPANVGGAETSAPGNKPVRRKILGLRQATRPKKMRAENKQSSQ
jgi:hypothetical protein